MKTALFLVAMVSGLMLAGCDTYFRVYSDYDRSVNFHLYRTFAWLPDKDTSKTQMNNQIVRNNTRNYISRAFGDRGYHLDVDSPDILLDLVIENVKRQETVTEPVYDGWVYNPYYYPYPGPWFYRYPYYYDYGMTYVVRKREYIENSITLNVIDRKKNQLVWTGTATGDLYDTDYAQDNLHPAVYEIMDRYPVKRR